MANKIKKNRLKRLAKLFQSRSVIRRFKTGELKVYDVSSSQRRTNRTTNSYNALRRCLNGIGHFGTTAATPHDSNRLFLYGDYDGMDTDPIIAAALDIYADETTMKNPDNTIIKITTNDKKKYDIIQNLLYDVINIEENLWSWTRNIVKYGDFFLVLDLKDNVGVFNVKPESPYYVNRHEGYDPDNPYAYQFSHTGGGGDFHNLAKDRKVYAAHEVIQLRMRSDVNFRPYGKSVIEASRKIFKQLTMMEDAMLISRIMRAPERRVYKIDVGNIPPEDVDKHMEEIRTSMQKQPHIDPKTGDYNLQFNVANMMEDYFLAVRGDRAGTDIDTLPGLDGGSQIEDIEYLRMKLMASLKIPSSFLGYDDGVSGKATLAAEDIRFSRTIERLQQVLLEGIKKIVFVHLYLQGFDEDDLLEFQLEMATPSIVYERMKIELMNEQMRLVDDMKNTELFSEKYIYKAIFNITDNEIKELRKEVEKDKLRKFKLEQIEQEGNNPDDSGQIMGTPHTMATLGMTDEEMPNSDDGRGRPTEPGTFETHDDVNGYDPTGKKENDKALKPTKKSTKDTTPKDDNKDGKKEKVTEGSSWLRHLLSVPRTKREIL